LLAYQYLQTLPQIAQGESNKMWIVPSEFSRALDGLARLAGGAEGEPPPWLAQQGADPGATKPIDTDGWFDSNLPPAALQPEAANLRASDDDEDSRLAREGLPEQPEAVEAPLVEQPAAAPDQPAQAPPAQSPPPGRPQQPPGYPPGYPQP
jgi:hypothetical protein